MNNNYIRKILFEVTKRMSEKSNDELILEIANQTSNLNEVSLENQYLLGAILADTIHKEYCKTINGQVGLSCVKNKPCFKLLSESLDNDFVLDVLNKKIQTDETLYIQDEKVFMDIANRSFSQLSPYWQYDNFMAGACAVRSVLTNWEGLNHDNVQIREYTAHAIASAIHESWIARGNVNDSNANLAMAYINLSAKERGKDLVHLSLAISLVCSLQQKISKK